ncbi:hypothetical protein PZ938_14540 [Luteipulveratus sp. YIM 133132]|uniref:hypothetical protein n=1 Tax=Luteipulveratus flavus TaxID=3031728 RepID=UPI0023AF30D5|nr:hypothetical protein [Luteipulveratus sp. YIM 133132]MDE9366830.1 hypothetical protein [Luteipulveratus sp. YIM 133132]
MKTNESSVLARWGRLLGAALGLSLVVGLVLVAFAWPSARSHPRDLPVAVTGPAAATVKVQERLDARQPGGFDLEHFASASAAEQAVRDREVYGVVELDGTDGPRVVTASAASPAVAQILTQLGQQLGTTGAEGSTRNVHDLVAAPANDPRGAAVSTSVLPLIIGGILATTVLDLLTGHQLRRAVAVVVLALSAGVVMALVLHTWLGAVGGDFWVLGAVAALGVGSIALTLTGLHGLFGIRGLGVGAATMMLLGNPLSAAASAPEMLPDGWSTVGQLLPPGAFVSLLGSVSAFGGAGSGGPLLVLLAWAVLGLVVCWAAHLRSPRHSVTDAHPAHLVSA